MKDKKTIWIVHQDASTPDTGFGGRHFYLAEEMAKRGHNVYVIASSVNHQAYTQPKLVGKFTFEEISGFTFVWVKMPLYDTARSKQRAINWLLFPWRIQKLAKMIPSKPDIVLCSSPPPIAFLGAQRLAKKFSAKLVFEVRDIWPLTLIELGGYSPRHPFIRFMHWVECRAYRDSDKVLSNLRNSVEHMVKNGLIREKFAWIANGFSLSEVNQNATISPEVAQQLPKNKFIIGYTGTLGFANSLITLLETAEMLKKNTAIHFVLVGRGQEKEQLKEFVENKKLSNVTFIDPIPKVQVQDMLSKFNACFIGWRKDELYNFGIGANKIPEYLYSGKPIIHAYSGACDPVEEWQAGLLAEAENPKAIADAILKLYQMPEQQRLKMGENGRKAALEEYEYGMLAKKLEDVLFE